MDPRASNIGLRVVLPQRDRFVEIGKRLCSGPLIAAQEATRGQHLRVFRFEFRRAVIICQRRVEIAGALARIGAGHQRPERPRIELNRGFGVSQRRIELAAADEKARAGDMGFDAIFVRPLRLVEDRRACGLGFFPLRPQAVLEVTGLGLPLSAA